MWLTLWEKLCAYPRTAPLLLVCRGACQRARKEVFFTVFLGSLPSLLFREDLRAWPETRMQVLAEKSWTACTPVLSPAPTTVHWRCPDCKSKDWKAGAM